MKAKQNKTKAISPLKVFPKLGKPMTEKQLRTRFCQLETEIHRIRTELEMLNAACIALSGFPCFNR